MSGTGCEKEEQLGSPASPVCLLASACCLCTPNISRGPGAQTDFCMAPFRAPSSLLLSPSPGSSQAQHVPDLGFRGKGISRHVVQKLQLLLPGPNLCSGPNKPSRSQTWLLSQFEGAEFKAQTWDIQGDNGLCKRVPPSQGKWVGL